MMMSNKLRIAVGFLLLAVSGSFYPSLKALAIWTVHRNTTFEDRSVSLPVFWNEFHTDYPTSNGWVKPPATAFSLFDNEVKTAVPYAGISDKFPISLWHKVYGNLDESDLEKYPELHDADRLGIQCGQLRHSTKTDQVAIACLSPDLKTTLAYSGSLRNLRGALVIVNQALARK